MTSTPAPKTSSYDIWKCPACNAHTLHRYRKLSSEWKKCPQCGHLTLSASSRTIVAATPLFTGQAEVAQTCRHCDFRSVQAINFPTLQGSDLYDDGNGESSSFGLDGQGLESWPFQDGDDFGESGSSGLHGQELDTWRPPDDDSGTGSSSSSSSSGGQSSGGGATAKW